MGIGKASLFSDHRPIYFHIALSKVQKGRGFWRLNGELLYDPAFIFGCNQVIRKTLLDYSEHTLDLEDPSELNDQVVAFPPSLISHSLLRNVILFRLVHTA